MPVEEAPAAARPAGAGASGAGAAQNPDARAASLAPATLLVGGLHLVACLLVWPGYRSITDVETMIALSESLLRGRITIVDPKSGIETVSPYGLGQSLLFLPAVAAARGAGGDPVLERQLVSLLNPAVTAVLGVLLFRAGAALGLGILRAAALSAAGIMGTPFWSMSQYAMSEPATAAALLGAVLAIATAATPGRHAVAGALLGYAVLARPSEIVLLPLFALGVAASSWRRSASPRGLLRDLAACGAGLAPGLAVFFAYNLARYGKLLVASYPGIPSGFTAPWAAGLPGLLWSRAAGLLWFAPVAALGLLMLPVLARRAPVAGGLSLAVFAVHLLLHAKWHMWWGGGTWGPRLLMPVVPLAVLGLVPLLARRRGAWVVGLVSIPSLAVSLLGAAHNPRHTARRLGDGPGTDVLGSQWELLHPVDLSTPMLQPTSGTFWPTLTWAGTACAGLGLLCLLGLLRQAGRLTPRTGAALLAPLILFAAVREVRIPYRVLRRPPAGDAAPSVVPPESMTLTCNGALRAPSAQIGLQGMARASFRTFLRRGVYALEAELQAPEADGVTFSCALLLDGEPIATTELGSRGSARLTSRAFRIHRRGHHVLEVTSTPGVAKHLRRFVVACREVRLLSEAPQPPGT